MSTSPHSDKWHVDEAPTKTKACSHRYDGWQLMADLVAELIYDET